MLKCRLLPKVRHLTKKITQLLLPTKHPPQWDLETVHSTNTRLVHHSLTVEGYLVVADREVNTSSWRKLYVIRTSKSINPWLPKRKTCSSTYFKMNLVFVWQITADFRLGQESHSRTRGGRCSSTQCQKKPCQSVDLVTTKILNCKGNSLNNRIQDHWVTSLALVRKRVLAFWMQFNEAKLSSNLRFYSSTNHSHGVLGFWGFGV